MDSVVGVLGAGSGLGVSGLIPAADGYVALGTEGDDGRDTAQGGAEPVLKGLERDERQCGWPD